MITVLIIICFILERFILVDICSHIYQLGRNYSPQFLNIYFISLCVIVVIRIRLSVIMFSVWVIPVLFLVYLIVYSPLFSSFSLLVAIVLYPV